MESSCDEGADAVFGEDGNLADAGHIAATVDFGLFADGRHGGTLSDKWGFGEWGGKGEMMEASLGEHLSTGHPGPAERSRRRAAVPHCLFRHVKSVVYPKR